MRERERERRVSVYEEAPCFYPGPRPFKQRFQFQPPRPCMLVLSPAAVTVTEVVNKYAAARRRLTQVVGVDVAFVVDALNVAVRLAGGDKAGG